MNMACLHDDLTCIIHLENVLNESIKPFTDKTWKTLSDCVAIWCKLDGKQRELAESLSLSVTLDLPPPNYGFHQTCYARLLDRH